MKLTQLLKRIVNNSCEKTLDSASLVQLSTFRRLNEPRHVRVYCGDYALDLPDYQAKALANAILEILESPEARTINT
jgi:hypothetical protein